MTSTSSWTAVIWTVALGGALMKLRYPRRFERLSIVIYLVLGWQGLFLVPSLFAALPDPTALLREGRPTGKCSKPNAKNSIKIQSIS